MSFPHGASVLVERMAGRTGVSNTPTVVISD